MKTVALIKHANVWDLTARARVTTALAWETIAHVRAMTVRAWEMTVQLMEAMNPNA